MISNITSQNFTINVPQAQTQYFSTLDAAFVYIRKYLEDRLGENIGVCIKETKLVINGKEKELYEIKFYEVSLNTVPQTPWITTPYIPDIAPQAPQGDEWWKTPIVYCGSVPQVTLNEGAAGNTA